MLRRASLGLSLLLATWSVAATAAADMRAGFAAWDEVEFELARDEFSRALQSPALTRADAAQAHAHLAAIAVILGDRESGMVHARIAVALDGNIAAPPGSPELVDRMLAEVKANQGGAALVFQVEKSEVSSGGVVRVQLEPAPEGVAEELRLRCDGRMERGRPAAGVELVLEDFDEVECEAEAVTSAGAVMFLVRTRPAEQVASLEEGGKRWRRWVWVAVALVAVGAGVGLGVGLTRDRGGEPTWTGTQVVGW